MGIRMSRTDYAGLVIGDGNEDSYEVMIISTPMCYEI